MTCGRNIHPAAPCKLAQDCKGKKSHTGPKTQVTRLEIDVTTTRPAGTSRCTQACTAEALNEVFCYSSRPAIRPREPPSPVYTSYLAALRRPDCYLMHAVPSQHEVHTWRDDLCTQTQTSPTSCIARSAQQTFMRL